MKRFFKWILYLIIAGVVVGFGYQQYASWQHQQDLAERAESPQGQLPDTLSPLHYNIYLTINPEESQFKGAVVIDVDLTKASDTLWLHGKNITAEKAEFITKTGESIALEYHEMGHSGVVRLKAKSEIPAQQGQLKIAYIGQFAKGLAGLYKVTEQGRSYIFSQFEATDARQAFPSFDEPRFKVPFDIKLTVKQNEQGITNTPQIAEKQLDNGFKELTFATTKPLPTYLLAFVVGDVDVVEYDAIPASRIRDRAIPLRGIATKGKGKDFEYALKNTASIVQTLENYFDRPYPYAKLDIVAVPDFAAGAMENAGLITYREQLLLLGDNPSLDQQRSYASVHAHELAHQWFGNLVTMKWWNDIWLNESFATWMANRTMNDWNPAFGFDRGMVRSGHGVMNQDLFADTRKIREPIQNNGDIENAFDGITYQKGGAVLQMLESYLGRDVFKKGVQLHMQKFAFGNATADDFIDSMVAVSNDAHIKTMFNSFLNQAGVPLVKVDYHCVDNKLTLNFEQQRYLRLGSTLSAEQTWTMPVCVSMINEQGNASSCVIMKDKTAQLTIDNAACPLAVMPNSDGRGYYRWTMPQDKQTALLAHLNQLSSAEKYSVASNLSAEFRAGRINVAQFVESAAPFAKQTEWDLVTAPVGEIEFIEDYIADDKTREKLNSRLLEAYQPILAKLGLEDNTELDKQNPTETKLLRKRIVALMSLKLKQPALVKQLAEQGKAYVGYQTDGQIHPDAVSSEMVQIALSSAVMQEGDAFADALIKMLDNNDDGTFRQRVLVAIASSDQDSIADKALDLATSFSLRINERLTLIGTLMRHKQNQPKVYAWFKRYYPALSLVVPDKFLSYTPMIGSGFCSKQEQQDVQHFFEPKLDELSGAKRMLSQVTEKIALCSALVEAQKNIQL